MLRENMYMCKVVNEDLVWKRHLDQIINTGDQRISDTELRTSDLPGFLTRLPNSSTHSDIPYSGTSDSHSETQYSETLHSDLDIPHSVTIHLETSADIPNIIDHSNQALLPSPNRVSSSTEEIENNPYQLRDRNALKCPVQFL
ncbi:hypothetical protein JTB14_005465 [Gonioctena quinquepunctata]|nr:hypothetical protein JTB14_005465 [Gonioctena quinquepunctata]